MKQAASDEHEIIHRLLPDRLRQPLAGVLQTILQQTASIAASIAVYDDFTGCFTQVIHHGDLERDVFYSLCSENGPARTAVSTRQALRISLAQGCTSGTAALLREHGLSCAIFLPLCEGMRCYGALCALHETLDRYDEAHETLMSSQAQLLTAIFSMLPPESSVRGTTDPVSRPDFLIGMSNEIRAPLNDMLGMLNLLKQTRLTLEQQEYVDTSQGSGNELLGLLNDVLDLSRIEAGRLKLEHIEFDLRHLVEDLVESFAGRAQHKRLELANIIFASVPAMVRGDPARLRQILTNLLANALRSTDAGEVVITVLPVEEDESGTLIGFEIRDTGAGITTEQQLLILDAADAGGMDARHKGSARLGLVISRQLAEYMGGETGIDSDTGKGSTVWFTARFGRCQPRPEQMKIPVEISRVRALVVNAHPTSCAVIEQMFLACGMQYEGVSDGATALQKLRRASSEGHAYDLVMLEMTLPDMSGFELGRKIDSVIAPGSCRKIMLTSHGRRGDAQSAREAGLHAYITQPIRSTQLRDVIGRVMGLEKNESDVLITRYSLSEAGAGWQYRILIVEDDLISQKVALAMLKKLGLRADIAGNGVDAVSAVRGHRYDIVLMDIQMPEMNGYEATAAIRELEQATSSGQHIPVIALTASALRGDRERCLDAGMDDYIAKPVMVEQLKDVLAQWLPADAGALNPKVDSVEHPALSCDPLDGPTFENLRLSLGLEFENVIEIYLDDAEKRIEEMRVAVESADCRCLNRAAHTLKSASRYIGILPLADLCYTTEKAADYGDLAMASSLVPLIGRVFTRAEAALRNSQQASLRA